MARHLMGGSVMNNHGTAPTPDDFIKKMGNHPVVDREEEHRLAVLYRETGDAEAARKLVEANLRLVVKVARSSCFRAASLPDLIQEGTLGLMKAVTKYDPDRGLRLSTYAVWWIRAYIHNYNITNGRVMRVVTTLPQRKLFYSLRREQAKLSASGGSAEAGVLAARLGVKEKDVREMEARLSTRDVTIDMTASSDSVRGGSGDLTDEGPGPDEALEQEEVRRAVNNKMQAIEGSLDEREKMILRQRLTADEPMTLQEVGRRFGISRERARQLEQRLKKHLQSHLASLADVAPASARAA